MLTFVVNNRFYPRAVTINKEFKVGALIFSALIVLYFGIDFLKGSDVFNPTRTYFVHYKNVDGLTASNPVMLDGFQVGLVKKIRIVQGTESKVSVQLEINKEIIISKLGKAMLSNNGFLGGKIIVLDPGRGEQISEGDTLIGSVVPGFTNMLEDKAQPMVNQVTHLVRTVDTLVASFHPTAAKLGETLEAVRKLSDASTGLVTDSRSEVHEIAENLQKLSASLLEAEKQLQQLLAKTDKITDSLNKADIAGAVHSLQKSAEQLNQTLGSINQGKGTLGKLIKSDSLYKNLNASSASLNSLLIDVKANPKRYLHFSLFGGKEKKQKSVAAAK